MFWSAGKLQRTREKKKGLNQSLPNSACKRMDVHRETVHANDYCEKWRSKACFTGTELIFAAAMDGHKKQLQWRLLCAYGHLCSNIYLFFSHLFCLQGERTFPTDLITPKIIFSQLLFFHLRMCSLLFDFFLFFFLLIQNQGELEGSSYVFV